jgi:hypothetical protein
MSEAGDPGRATKYVDILPCGCRIVDDCKLHGPDSIALAALQKERDEAVAMINSASRNPVGFGDFINRQIEQERDAALAKVEELKADIETILYECRVMGAEIEAHASAWMPQPYVNYVSWKAYDKARRAIEEGK